MLQDCWFGIKKFLLCWLSLYLCQVIRNFRGGGQRPELSIVIPRAFYRCFLTTLFGAHREAGNLETWRKKTSSKKTHKRIWRGGGGQLLKWQRRCKRRERMKECFFVTPWLFQAPSKDSMTPPQASTPVVQSLSRVRLFDPMDGSSPGFPFCLHPSNWLTSLLSVQRHFWDTYHYFPW